MMVVPLHYREWQSTTTATTRRRRPELLTASSSSFPTMPRVSPVRAYASCNDYDSDDPFEGFPEEVWRWHSALATTLDLDFAASMAYHGVARHSRRAGRQAAEAPPHHRPFFPAWEQLVKI
jgi:hypothetical protein